MAQRTTADAKLPRPELATHLATLAEDVDFSVDVIERSSMLRGSRETIEIELSWKS